MTNLFLRGMWIGNAIYLAVIALINTAYGPNAALVTVLVTTVLGAAYTHWNVRRTERAIQNLQDVHDQWNHS